VEGVTTFHGGPYRSGNDPCTGPPQGPSTVTVTIPAGFWAIVTGHGRYRAVRRRVALPAGNRGRRRYRPVTVVDGRNRFA